MNMKRRDFLKGVGVAAIILPGVGFAQSVGSSTSVLVEAENFKDLGGWGLDTQFMDQMGSPYLLAHGLGVPVKDAVTTVAFPETGEYKVWVRTKDWVGQWKTPETPEGLRAKGTPGEFQLLVNGKPLAVTFGNEGADWHWQDGGKVAIDSKDVSLALHDLTGYEGRCDAILFTKGATMAPPNAGKEMTEFRRKLLGLPEKPEDVGEFDLVVVGAGLAGTCAAVSAARLGLTVAFVQDRPVLGGNNSSEIGVPRWGNINLPPYPNLGNIVKELFPAVGRKAGDDENFIAKVKAEKNLKLFLGFRVNEAKAESGRVKEVVAQDIRTARRIRVGGKMFADCTGDAAVGFLADADYAVSRKEHQGPTNYWSVNDDGKPSPFPHCEWALNLSDKPFPGRHNEVGQFCRGAGLGNLNWQWYWECGFSWDPILDREKMRDWNLRAMYGAWDALKNVDKLYPNHKITRGIFISGVRESRRLLGDVQLTKADLVSGKKWDDACFPCSWGIDVHIPHPKYKKGFEGNEFISIVANNGGYHGPYWVPYRCLYSRNISNLFMAGRDISVTHEALGPVRVQRTCGMMGEIVGMAASICKKQGATPREVYEKHLAELKSLMEKGVAKA